jgi:hypothetical protein
LIDHPVAPAVFFEERRCQIECSTPSS